MEGKTPYLTSNSSGVTSQATSQSLTSSYPESQAPSTSGSSAVKKFHSQPKLSFVIGGKAHLFPSIFGIYRDGSKKLFLAEHHISTPFMVIALQSGISGEPSIVLSSPTAVMGTADIHSYTSKTDIVVGSTSTFLQSTWGLSPTWPFTYTFDDGRQEKFEWKKSSGDAVAGLGGRSKGHKLVRVSNGEVVAAWTQPGGTSLDKLAKIGLLDSARSYGWGERWEVTVVVSAIALVERQRAAANNAISAA